MCMNLVSNIIGGIGLSSAGSISAGFDLNDTTFANLLQKQIEKVSQNESLEAQSLNLGAPPGFEIEGIEPEVNVQNISEETNLDNITTSETVTFFSSLLDNKGNPESDIFDFAKKQAANLYNKYSRSIVTDVSEFVEDIKNMI